MKKLSVLLLFLVLSPILYAQTITFPESFKAGEKMFPGLSVAKITPKITAETGLVSASGVSDDSKFIQKIAKPNYPIAMIKSVYYEVYQGKKNKSDDAGVLVLEFNNNTDLDNIVGKLNSQSNYVQLRKDNYLIKIWSDESSNSETTLQRLSTYYQAKIGAVELKNTEISTGIETTNDDALITLISEAEEENEMSELELEQRAYHLMQNDNYESAIATYKKVILRNPKNDRAHFNIVWMYATTDQNEKAIEASEIALKAVEEDKKYRYLQHIGICYTDMGQYYDGMQYLLKAKKLAPNDYLTIYNLGYNRFRAKDYTKAIDLLKAALTQQVSDNKKADLHFYIGTSYSELDSNDLALQYLDSAIELNQYESFYANKAHIYSKLENYEQAVFVCTEGISFNPESAILYHKRYQAKKDLKQLASANDDLRQAYVLDETNPDILLDMAVLYDNDNKTDAALALYRKALESAVADKQKLYTNIANILGRNPITIDSAMMYYNKAIAENPKAFEPYYNLANTYKDLKNYKDAENYYKIANERNPNNKSVLTNLGLIVNEQGKNAEALQILNLAYELYPNEFELNLSLAKIYTLDSKNYPLVEKHATKAIQNEVAGKSSISAYSIRGNARMQNGAYANAIADYLEIINRTSNNILEEHPELYSNIGYCYLYQNQYDNAKTYFNHCLEIHTEIDAIIGLALVAQANNQPKELHNYRKQAIKTFPKLKQGEEGIKALEADEYHYTPEIRKAILEIFTH